MKRWKVRFVMYKRDEYEAEALNAGAVGLAPTPFQAMEELVDQLKTLAVVSVEHGTRFVVEDRDEDVELYNKLIAGDVPADVAAFGEITIELRKDGSAEVAHLQKMELVGGTV
jgi:hypothetical protein